MASEVKLGLKFEDNTTSDFTVGPFNDNDQRLRDLTTRIKQANTVSFTPAITANIRNADDVALTGTNPITTATITQTTRNVIF